MEQIVVVGASAAGLTTVEALRRGSYAGRIVLVGSESRLPYDRPPLSKQVLSGAWVPERTELRGADHLDGLDIDLRMATAAVGLDLAGRQVELAGGERVDYDGLVIATGVRPRSLPAADGLAGVHVLRTLDDAIALRSELEQGGRLVVIGAGLIGCEVAATARGLGLEVALVEPQQVPMQRQLGATAGALLAELHVENGVQVFNGVGVTGLESTAGRVSEVLLEDGTRLPADVVLIGVGSTPAVEWLRESGLPVGPDGVQCDHTCAAAPGVYAAGDVASWEHRGFGRRLRLEHRTNATEQAIAVAANLLAAPGEQRPFEPLPYFWSDQYQVKIQTFGLPSAQDELEIVEGDPAARKFVGLYRNRGRVTAVMGWNSARALRNYRQQVLDGLASPN